ncbi:MAG: hypothetical protein P8Z37_12170 [Acidobacteriota bacterium]
MKILIIILIIAAVAAVATVLILRYKQPRVTSQTVAGNPESPIDYPPKPKWKPQIPVDLDRIVKTFQYYSDNEKVFVVFENGTCVPIDADSNQPEQDALALLDRLYHQHPDFNPILMDDGNWMISHSDVAFSICFADEIESNWEIIDKNHLDALARGEVLLNAKQQPNVFDKRGKVGLFGRTRWFMDCENPKVVGIEGLDSK